MSELKRWTSSERPRVNRHTGCVEYPFPEGAAADMDDHLLIHGCDLHTLAHGFSPTLGYDVLTIEAVPRKARTP